jgi:hypothetical protein
MPAASEEKEFRSSGVAGVQELTIDTPWTDRI